MAILLAEGEQRRRAAKVSRLVRVMEAIVMFDILAEWINASRRGEERSRTDIYVLRRTRLQIL